MIDFTNLKAEIIRKYIEHKNFLSKIDTWSSIKKPNYFSFKTSQTQYRYIKGNKEYEVIEERVSSGKMSLLLKIPEIKLDDFSIDTIEILQDIDLRLDKLVFLSSNFIMEENFHTKNTTNQKSICIYDVKYSKGQILIKLFVSKEESIEIIST